MNYGVCVCVATLCSVVVCMGYAFVIIAYVACGSMSYDVGDWIIVCCIMAYVFDIMGYVVCGITSYTCMGSGVSMCDCMVCGFVFGARVCMASRFMVCGFIGLVFGLWCYVCERMGRFIGSCVRLVVCHG